MEEPDYVLIDRKTRTAFAVDSNGADLICAGLDAANNPFAE